MSVHMVCLIIYSIKQIEMCILLSILIYESVCSTAQLLIIILNRKLIIFSFILFLKPICFWLAMGDGNSVVKSSHFLQLIFSDVFFSTYFFLYILLKPFFWLIFTQLGYQALVQICQTKPKNREHYEGRTK